MRLSGGVSSIKDKKKQKKLVETQTQCSPRVYGPGPNVKPSPTAWTDV